MTSTNMRDLREQIIANARILCCDRKSTADNASLLRNDTSATLTPSTPAASTLACDIEVVVYCNESTDTNGTKPNNHTAVVMVGRSPAIEGKPASTTHSALFKLLAATSELLNLRLPKLGSHQRNIHQQGGVYDDDFMYFG